MTLCILSKITVASGRFPLRAPDLLSPGLLARLTIPSMNYLLWSRSKSTQKSMPSYLSISNVTVLPVATSSCQAGCFCMTESVGSFSPRAPCIALSSTTEPKKQRERERVQLSFLLILLCQANCTVTTAIGSYQLVMLGNQQQ